jgi:sensor c-di-GMP phosphodiesterase-like protein
MGTSRDRVLVFASAAALVGFLLPLLIVAWYLWQESVVAEESRLAELSKRFGQQTENAIIDARDLLDRINGLDVTPCSPEHLAQLQEAAMSRPHVRAIGYWRAAQRECGAGFVQGQALTPPRASRIYDTGVIAWWPGPTTAVGDVELFLMRYGQHDLAIDPRLLITPGLLDATEVGLWVEGMPMAVHPADARLPEPHEIRPGLSVDRASGRIVNRFSLGTIFPIDIVAVQPLSHFWDRYFSTFLGVGVIGLLLVSLWLAVVLRYLRRHFSLSSELRDAILNDRLSIVYQPIVDLGTGRCCGAEALARWHHRNNGTIGPEIFVPIAEQSGLGTELSLAVLRAVLRDLGEQLRNNSNLVININITEQDLTSPLFSEAMKALLEREGVPASSIKLEITERSLLKSDDIRQRVRLLRGRGHRIAIDDFGTGYSSLAYLESFELDTLKIDKSFVNAIETHAVTNSVIRHIIEMAQSLRLDIVAEGLESAHQVDWLHRQGVGFGQGFLFSQPLSADRFQTWGSEH